jgi:mannose-1-phosphate guanylyltransferase/mannose-6-phosphate isomerase
MIIPVILSGGSGSRLWPLSRVAYPKQFLSLVEESSLLGSTFRRVQGIAEIHAPIVIANAQHRFEVAAELQRLGMLKDALILLEPVPRNTAPAIAAAAHQALVLDPEAQILVLPADHVIENPDAFCRAVECGISAASIGKLVTFGIVPQMPHTGYGYIHSHECGSEGWGAIVEFKEKPDKATAERYVASGKYYWNSGMFLFKAARYLEELEATNAEMVRRSYEALRDSQKDLDFIRLEESSFSACPSDSIDYAVMERTTEAVMVPLDAGWSDVGSWSSLWEIGKKDEQGNVSKGDVLLEESSNCYVHSNGRLIATIGVSDQVIVETSDAILVADRAKVQEVKNIVDRLKSQERPEYRVHKKMYRPWGTCEVMVKEDRFQVMRITINPGQRLSLQMHHHRAEHWVVVRGTALVKRDADEILLSEDQSTYMPLGVKHYIANPGLIPLEIIEVQTGSYIGDDDVVRLDDIYGRV